MNNSVLRCLASIFTFTILFTACSKDYSVETGVSLAATGSLQDANGNCMHDTTIGTFYNGVIPNGNLTGDNDTAYVLVKVNVTTVGSYNITSTTENGLYFSDSGYFTNTGLETIKLKPVGTAILPISSTYSISFDTTTCYFTVIAKDSTGTGRGGNTGGGGGGTGGGGTGGGGSTGVGTWQFTSPAGTIVSGAGTGTYDGNTITITGSTVTNDSMLVMAMVVGSSIPTSGQFSTTTLGTQFAFENFNTLAPIYNAAATLGKITFTITSYDATSKELKGTFTGTVFTATGSTVSITKGAFDVVVI